MSKTELLQKIDDCMMRVDVKNLSSHVQQLLSGSGEQEACSELATLLLKFYSTHKSGAAATLLETIIRVKPQIAVTDFPQNFFFKLAVLKGSKELYECYMEEGIGLYLEGKTEEERAEAFMQLYGTAESLNEKFFPQYARCIKGMDFNGAFGHDPDREHIVFINREDYELMDDVVEKYNAIVGRRDILEDLLSKA